MAKTKATASNSEANRKVRYASVQEASEAPEHATLNITLFDESSKDMTIITRYFRDSEEKQDFIASMKRGT